MDRMVVLHGAKLISKPSFEIRDIKGIKTPQHFGTFYFTVMDVAGRSSTVHINAHTRETDISQFDKFYVGQTIDLVAQNVVIAFAGRTYHKLYFKAIKES